MKARSLVLLGALSAMLAPAGVLWAQQTDASAKPRTIIFIWDGLRADDLTPEITPYFALARTGAVFADHHAVYPTFTMMNSASIATGTYPGAHGFYGNVVYAPGASGKNAKGSDIDFSASVFIEDFGVVEAVREAYQGRLTLVPTLLQAAQAKGLTTAAIGKFGAAFNPGLPTWRHHPRRGRSDARTPATSCLATALTPTLRVH
jgi:arylsulfatase A-like enzyme